MAKRPKPYTEKKHLTRRELRKILIGASGSLAPLIKKKSLAQRVFKAVSFRIRKHFDLWSLAWAEFGLTRGYSWLKRGTGIVAFALFTWRGSKSLCRCSLCVSFSPLVWLVLDILCDHGFGSDVCDSLFRDCT